MKCPKPPFNCYFCYNGECYATHWWECAEGFRKPHEGRKVTKIIDIARKKNSYESIYVD